MSRKIYILSEIADKDLEDIFDYTVDEFGFDQAEKYLLEIEGLCSIEADAEDDQLEVTCKVDKDTYKKHFLGLSDNVSYFVEQMEPIEEDPYHYKVIFKPEEIIPDIEMSTN